MNESVGYTVTINIVITFIIIVFAFISNILIYYKSNKVGNVIVNSIEKYGGFNDLARQEIENNLTSIGYNKTNITCPSKVEEKNEKECTQVYVGKTEKMGYCVYMCDMDNEYYYYKIKANMIINIPIINNIVNGSVFSTTGNLYNFVGVSKPASIEDEIFIGDVNEDGLVTDDDAKLIQYYTAGMATLDADQLKAADVDGDGSVTTFDATRLRKMIDEQLNKK